MTKSIKEFWNRLKRGLNGERWGAYGFVLGGLVTPVLLGVILMCNYLVFPTFIQGAVYVVRTFMDAIGEGIFGDGTMLASTFGRVFGFAIPYGIIFGGMAIKVGMDVTAEMMPNAREMIENGFVVYRDAQGKPIYKDLAGKPTNAHHGFLQVIPGTDLYTEEGAKNHPSAKELHEDYLRWLDTEGEDASQEEKNAKIEELASQHVSFMNMKGPGPMKQLQGLLLGVGLFLAAPLALNGIAAKLGWEVWSVVKGMMCLMAPFTAISSYHEKKQSGTQAQPPHPSNPTLPETMKEAIKRKNPAYKPEAPIASASATPKGQTSPDNGQDDAPNDEPQPPFTPAHDAGVGQTPAPKPQGAGPDVEAQDAPSVPKTPGLGA